MAVAGSGKVMLFGNRSPFGVMKTMDGYLLLKGRHR